MCLRNWGKMLYVIISRGYSCCGSLAANGYTIIHHGVHVGL